MRRLAGLGLALAALAAAACGTHADREPAWRVRELAAPAQAGSGEPNLALTPDGRALLSWVEPKGEAGHALRFAWRRKGGAWSEARTIAEGRDWFVNWADFPSLAAAPGRRTFAHWLVKSGPAVYAYDVRLATSPDDGVSWGGSFLPHRDGTPTEHGFVSLVPWDDGGFGVVWLDGRRTHGVAPGQGETSLYYATVAADGTLGPETPLDDRVCDCCQTAAVRAGSAVVVVYRDRSPDEIRDVSVVRLVDGRWSEPRALHGDGWKIHGCPVNGPAIAAAGSRVAVAWFTAAAERSRVQLVLSEDAGGSFGVPIAVDQRRPLGRVDVAFLPGGDALVSWLEQGPKGAELRVRGFRRDGKASSPLTVADSSSARSSGFPRMEVLDGEPVLAWRDVSDPARIRTAVLEAAR